MSMHTRIRAKNLPSPIKQSDESYVQFSQGQDKEGSEVDLRQAGEEGRGRAAGSF